MKKFVALFLALALCMGLAIPALAADGYEEVTIEHANFFGTGTMGRVTIDQAKAVTSAYGLVSYYEVPAQVQVTVTLNENTYAQYLIGVRWLDAEFTETGYSAPTNEEYALVSPSGSLTAPTAQLSAADYQANQLTPGQTYTFTVQTDGSDVVILDCGYSYDFFLQAGIQLRYAGTSAQPETHEEWQARMGGEVLAVLRSGLYLEFRFLDQALGALQPVPDERCGVLATDGVNLYYQPSALLRLYRQNPKYLNRLYLHAVFHCVFRHLWMQGSRDPVLWHTACDIAVENVIDGLGRKSVARPLTYVRRRAYEALTAGGHVAAAAPAYRWLLSQTPGVQKQLAREFYADDHRLWPRPGQPDPPMPQVQAQAAWQKIGRRMETELELHAREAGDEGGNLAEAVKAANRSRSSYRDFLRRFCVLREEPRLDPDTFDLNFYTYGLSVYGNMPLIEPVETRESKKIEEIALVIDTSYSTSGALVRSFLSETYALLKQRESFFRRMNLHIIQADNQVQRDHLVTTEDQLIDLMDHFELAGGGGTDFRPAFEYVTRLCEEKKFQNLRGLLYFTDGMGTYPARRPPYDTAFLFLGDRFDGAGVPPWAMKVVLDEDEFVPPAPAAARDAQDEDVDLYRELNNS